MSLEIFKNLFIGLTLMVLSACNYSVNKVGDGGPVASLETAQLDYAFVRAQVLSPACYECHSSATVTRGGVNLDNYNDVKNNIVDVEADVRDGSMPKNRPPLTANQKQIILAWIAAGAPEQAVKSVPAPGNEPPPLDPPPPPPVPTPEEGILDFATVYRQVIEPTCFKCHQAPNNRGDVNLETYAEVLKNIKAVKETIEDGSMPRRNTLTPEQKSLILNWIAAGAPENALPAGGPVTDSQVLSGSLVDFLLTQKKGE